MSHFTSSATITSLCCPSLSLSLSLSFSLFSPPLPSVPFSPLPSPLLPPLHTPSSPPPQVSVLTDQIRKEQNSVHELEEALKARGERPQSPELDDLRSHVERDQDEICTLKQQIMEKDTRVRYRGCAADCAVCVSEGVRLSVQCVCECVWAECAVCVWCECVLTEVEAFTLCSLAAVCQKFNTRGWVYWRVLMRVRRVRMEPN